MLTYTITMNEKMPCLRRMGEERRIGRGVRGGEDRRIKDWKMEENRGGKDWEEERQMEGRGGEEERKIERNGRREEYKII